MRFILELHNSVYDSLEMAAYRTAFADRTRGAEAVLGTLCTPCESRFPLADANDMRAFVGLFLPGNSRRSDAVGRMTCRDLSSGEWW